MHRNWGMMMTTRDSERVRGGAAAEAASPAAAEPADGAAVGAAVGAAEEGAARNALMNVERSSNCDGCTAEVDARDKVVPCQNLPADVSSEGTRVRQAVWFS